MHHMQPLWRCVASDVSFNYASANPHKNVSSDCTARFIPVSLSFCPSEVESCPIFGKLDNWRPAKWAYRGSARQEAHASQQRCRWSRWWVINVGNMFIELVYQYVNLIRLLIYYWYCLRSSSTWCPNKLASELRGSSPAVGSDALENGSFMTPKVDFDHDVK